MAVVLVVALLGLIHRPAATPGRATGSRRGVIEQTAALCALAPAVRLSALLPPALAAVPPGDVKRAVVLGGSGFVGTRVCEQLVGLGVQVVSVSRGGRPTTAASGGWADRVEWVAADASDARALGELMRGADVAISAAGAIFGSGEAADRTNNAAPNVAAAAAAAAAGVRRFVLVSVSADVEPVTAPLVGGGYFRGKADAEAAVLAQFPPDRSLLIKPTFIYGGESFSLSPPRVSSAYGALVDGALSAPPSRALASVAPGAVRLALLPPVSVDAVAAAAVAGALGLARGSVDGHDAIVAAAAALEK
ncbi:hypothetical protein KFE25_001583 [Diacronema lutheri]|uniref:NAD(P)-binding domain-containing protein n=1 Tax=Diacronema lutheri TaxID=2081491 RepID=A0A8J5XGY9_DIALT|nr:hypothetical protein KFE25_001583 [Diacronema lutheri]